MHDLGLAMLHHVLVFGMVAMLAMELSGLKAATLDVGRLARLDGGYGLTAMLVILVGVLRVTAGPRGWAFYETNPYFWAKIATFVLIGLLSIAPTVTFIRWRRAMKADAAFQPTPDQLRRVRRLVGLQLALIFPLVAFAAAMARYPF